MAEPTEEKQEGTAEQPKKSKKGLIIGLSVAGVLLLAGVPGGYLLLHKKGPQTEELDAHAASHGTEGGLTLEGADDADELEEGEEQLGSFFPLETFIVNVPQGGFLRVQIQIEFKQRDIPRSFYTKMTPIRDQIISILSGKDRDLLLSAKGRDQIKEAVKTSINDMLKKEEVQKVYFTQYVVQ